MSSLVLSPALSFEELARRLCDAGWRREGGGTSTPPLVAGEPELATWSHGDARLTYTFNPAVRLRVVAVTGDHADDLAALLPIEREADIERALRSNNTAEVLRGIFAARETIAVTLAGSLGLLGLHADAAVRREAARAHLDLLHAHARSLVVAGQLEPLVPVLAAIAGNALPLLAALPQVPADELFGLKPTEEECAAAFHVDVAPRVFRAYEPLWERGIKVEPGVDRRMIDVNACPSELLAANSPVARAFPEGYRAVAPMLRPGWVWLAWRYTRAHGTSGLAFDGLVRIRERWVWFPKPYRVLAAILN